MNLLIVDHFCIGDHVALVMPFCKSFYEQGHKIDCMVSNENVMKLMSHMPYFRNLIPQDPSIELDALKERSKLFPQYDKVYIFSRDIYKKTISVADPEVMKNVDPRILPESETDYWPVELFNRFQMEYKPYYILLDLDWYKDYYRNFECKRNSVLLNTQARLAFRTYNKREEVKAGLIKHGFEVREIDTTVDIRTNLFLINQVKHIITVDTSVFWMARSLGKSPYCFFHQDPDGYRQFSSIMLNVTNLVPWYDYLNDIPPEVIVDCFVEKVKTTLLI